MYSTSFQCPDTGLMVIARYAGGKVSIRPADDDDLLGKLIEQGDITQEQAAEARADTAAYCKRHSGQRCGSIDEADQYIVEVSQGQTFGFDRSRY